MNQGNEINIKYGDYVARGSSTPRQSYIRGVFFDGTGNNKNNIDENVRSRANRGTSYESAYSNVAKLWACCNSNYRIYIDGIGTTTGKGDNKVPGQAFGSGKTGIPSRVEQACKIVADSFPKGARIDTITIDTFGFSRGAAAARHFVSKISYPGVENPNRPVVYTAGYLGFYLAKRNIQWNTLRIRFVGIFDTVSAYTDLPIPPNFSNVDDLELNNLDLATAIVHLTANDEHRDNFGLTRVPSGPNRFEMGMPGVHSDIGGGYKHGETERVTIAEGNEEKLNDEAQELFRQSWYVNGQLEIVNWGFLGGRALRGTRTLSGLYSIIPLVIMATGALNFQLPIFTDVFNRRFYKFLNSDRFLSNIATKLINFAKTPSAKFYLTDGERRRLRNKYLHWSSHLDSIGMGPRIVNGRRERAYF